MTTTTKAQFMELDLIMAIMLIAAAVMLFKSYSIHDYDNPQLENLANDAATSLQTRTVNTLDNAYLTTLQERLDDQGTGITINNSNTIARQAAILLIKAEEQHSAFLRTQAADLIRHALEELIPPTYAYNVTMLSNDQRYELASSSEPITIAATQSRILLSGLQVDKPVYGYKPTVYLSSARTRKDTYAYLGGFVGQGNITLTMTLPEEINNTQLYVEGDFHDAIAIAINGNTTCQTLALPANHGPQGTLTQAYLPLCAQQLQPGENTIHIRFTGENRSNHYVGGGYFRATYTGEATYLPTATITYTFPGIRGIFNLYDAIHIPGELRHLQATLHYYSNHEENNNTVFFSLGNTTIYADDDSTTEQVITLTNEDFQELLDYDELTDATIPLRMGYANVSKGYLTGSLVDTVLITDLSGSMGDPIDSWTRINLAKEVDKRFIRTILAAHPDNRIGLVGYDYEAREVQELTGDEELLNDTVDDYSIDGYTCTACGIREAIQLIQDAPEENYRSIMVMSDGEANWCYNEDGYCAGISSWHGNACDCSDSAAVAQAVHYAQEAHDQGIDVYAVAFTSGGSSSMRAIAQVNGADWTNYYRVGNDADELIDAYEEIARRIINLGRYRAQIVELPTNDDSILYPDSTLTYTFTPTSLGEARGQLLVTGEHYLFNGTTTPIEERILNGLVAYWHFNDGTFDDQTGNGNDGVASGPFITAEGYSGQGMSSDGNRDYVDVGSFTVPGEELTLAGWFFIDHIPTDADPRLISKGTSTNHQDWTILIEREGYPEFRVNNHYGGHNGRLQAFDIEVNEDEWHHLAGVYDNGNMKLYYDGILAAEGDIGTNMEQNNSNVWLGGQPNQPDQRSFPGLLDEIRVYERALSEDEIRELAGLDAPIAADCTSQPIDFPRTLTPIDAKITSYSAQHWTETLTHNGHTLYDLSTYGSYYNFMGDPFTVYVPTGTMTQTDNVFSLTTADSPSEQTGCSPHDKLLYTAALNSTFTLNEVYPQANGCTWTVSFPSGLQTINFPIDYTGNSTCRYTPAGITYNGENDWAANQDAWQMIAYELFSSFDLDPQDGTLDLDFDEAELQANLEEQDTIPYLWGPALLEVVVWQ